MVNKALAPLDFKTALDFRNAYIITLKRDEVRTEHVVNLTKSTFFNSNIYWAIDGKNISDATITQWKRQKYLANNLVYVCALPSLVFVAASPCTTLASQRRAGNTKSTLSVLPSQRCR